MGPTGQGGAPAPVGWGPRVMGLYPAGSHCRPRRPQVQVVGGSGAAGERSVPPVPTPLPLALQGPRLVVWPMSGAAPGPRPGVTCCTAQHLSGPRALRPLAAPPRGRLVPGQGQRRHAAQGSESACSRASRPSTGSCLPLRRVCPPRSPSPLSSARPVPPAPGSQQAVPRTPASWAGAGRAAGLSSSGSLHRRWRSRAAHSAAGTTA